MSERKVLNIQQIAERIGVCEETARRWIVSRKVPAFRFTPRGRWRAYSDELDNWIASHKDGGGSGQAAA